MMQWIYKCSAACAVIALAAWSADANATAARTFVATTGSDANTATNCGATTPCRSFSAALSVTGSGGEVIVLNSGGYGPITITQSVTITAPAGIYAGITAGQTLDGIDINGAGIEVTLRGLTINSTAVAPTLGGIGVNIEAAAIVTLDRLLVQNFPNMGVSTLVSPQATPLVLNVQDSTFVQNSYEFWLVPSSSSATVTATFNNVTMNGPHPGNVETAGIYMVDNTTVSIANSQIANEAVGIFALSTTAPLSLVAANCVFNNGQWDVASNVGSISGAASIELRNNVLTGTSTTNLSQAAGIRIGTGATASLYANTITGNSVGVVVEASGLVYSYANNQFRSNGSNVTGSLTAISAL